MQEDQKLAHGQVAEQAFTITDQSEAPDYSDPNGAKTVHTIQYETPSGYTGQVVIPDREYSAAHIAALVAAKAHQQEEVGRLRSGPLHKPL